MSVAPFPYLTGLVKEMGRQRLVGRRCGLLAGGGLGHDVVRGHDADVLEHHAVLAVAVVHKDVGVMKAHRQILNECIVREARTS